MALLLAALLVAYNNAINRWAPFRTWAYLPANIAMTAVVVAVWREPVPVGARATEGMLLGAIVVAGLVVALLVKPSLVADARYAQMDAKRMAYTVLARIPIGTALVEEVLFRGVLYAAFLEHGTEA